MILSLVSPELFFNFLFMSALKTDWMLFQSVRIFDQYIRNMLRKKDHDKYSIFPNSKTKK